MAQGEADVRILSKHLSGTVPALLVSRGTVIWYDPQREWEPWVCSLLTDSSAPAKSEVNEVQIGASEARLVFFAGSYYEVVRACEPLIAGCEKPNLLIYIPGEPYREDLSPLRELECLGGEREPFQRSLAHVARHALQDAGLADSEIDELLEGKALTFEYVDGLEIGGNKKPSPLAPIFGSGRELDVVTGFLVDPEKREKVSATGLVGELQSLIERGLGLPLTKTESMDDLKNQLARGLLVAEMRSDLEGDEPSAIAQVPKPTSAKQVERVQSICRRLRRDHGELYEQLADQVEKELGLTQATIDPTALGHIDTFRFEEQLLLDACCGWLANGDLTRALDTIEERHDSFWVSVSRFPDRHAAWQACAELARLQREIENVESQLKKKPGGVDAWISSYTAPDGWHWVDRRYRHTRQLLRAVGDDAALDQAAEKVFARYEALLQRMAESFVEALRSAGWRVSSELAQTDIFAKRVRPQDGPVAFILADAFRYEMGAELRGAIEADGATTVQLEPASACLPSITEVGMAALLPGAEKSFTIQASDGDVAGVIEGNALGASAARMDHARGEVPGLVDLTLETALDLSRGALAQRVQGAPVVVIRSQEIDGAGESLSAGLARTVMGTVLQDLRSVVMKLASAGVSRFVITADHGHLFASPRGEDMRIPPPDGGEKAVVHRRCWLGIGGSTPAACVRVPASELGYAGCDLDLVIPKGMAVFRSGGSLAYHHGGASLQELIIPVLTIVMPEPAEPGRKGESPVALEQVQSPITNAIFSAQLRRTDLPMDPLRLRVLAVAVDDGRIVGEARYASAGWDAPSSIVTLQGSDPVAVGIQLDDEDATEVRVRVVEVGTDRVMKESEPIPVNLLR